MSKLHWDDTGRRFYELGVKKCVLFKMVGDRYHSGVPWSGVISITNKHEGAEENAFWSDGLKYGSLITTEDFKATIEAYQCPTDFYECDGTYKIKDDIGLYATNQERIRFGLCYTTTVGNDTYGVGRNEKIHLIYDAVASPSERQYATINQSPEALTLSWDLTTRPMFFSNNYRPCAHFIIDTGSMSPNLKKELENILYGTDSTNSTLPGIMKWQTETYSGYRRFTTSLEEILTYPVLIDSLGNIVVNASNEAVLTY